MRPAVRCDEGDVLTGLERAHYRLAAGPALCADQWRIGKLARSESRFVVNVPQCHLGMACPTGKHRRHRVAAVVVAKGWRVPRPGIAAPPQAPTPDHQRPGVQGQAAWREPVAATRSVKYVVGDKLFEALAERLARYVQIGLKLVEVAHTEK